MRRYSAMSILYALLLSAGAPVAAADSPSRPNVIVILTDDQGYGDLGCYGATDIDTPHLDRMAAEGMRFTDFHVQAGVCSPSRASLLTGVYPRRAGVGRVLTPHSGGGLRADIPTIAEMLKPQGYATMCVGKWHLGHRPGRFPTDRGFDSYFGIPYSNDMGQTVISGEIDPERTKPPLPLMRDDRVIETEPDQKTLTRRYTEEAVKFIAAHKKQPFFLYLPHTFPHWPWFASEKFKGRSERGLYGDMIEEIDWSCGRILDTVNDLGLAEKTLVVFTSDNGPALMEDKDFQHGSAGPLRGGKFHVFEAGHRVPCLMWWPSQIPSGAVCKELVTAMDIAPTVNRLAGVSGIADDHFDGHDIWPILSGRPGATSPYDVLLHFKGPRIGAVRVGHWKLVMPHGKYVLQPELYDLTADIGEQNDLASANPELAKRMQQQGREAVEALRPHGSGVWK